METIYFDEDNDFGSLDFDLEKESSQQKSTNHTTKKSLNQLNAIGITSEEMETVFVIIFGFLFVILLVGVLMGYTTWYFNQS